MKKLAVILMVVGLFGAVPVFAAEHEGMKMDTKEGVRECALQAESIQKKVKRIQGELKKDAAKYSPEELATLNQKLKEANDTLDTLTKQ